MQTKTKIRIVDDKYGGYCVQTAIVADKITTPWRTYSTSANLALANGIVDAMIITAKHRPKHSKNVIYREEIYES